MCSYDTGIVSTVAVCKLLKDVDLPAHTVSHHDSLWHLECIQQPNNVVRKTLNALLNIRIRRTPCTCRVERDASEIVCLQAQSYSLVVVLRGPKTVHEDEGFARISVWLQVRVVYLFVSDLKERHCGWVMMREAATRWSVMMDECGAVPMARPAMMLSVAAGPFKP